jgi:hypothetical protein
MTVGYDNGAKLLRVQLAVGHLNDAPRPGVHQYLCPVEIKPEAAGGKELTDYHEAGAAGAQKSNGFVCLIFFVHVDSTIRYGTFFYKLSY